MSLAERTELRLVPAILPLPCAGRVALVPSDPRVLFSPLPTIFLSVSHSYRSAPIPLADGPLIGVSMQQVKLNSAEAK